MSSAHWFPGCQRSKHHPGVLTFCLLCTLSLQVGRDGSTIHYSSLSSIKSIVFSSAFPLPYKSQDFPRLPASSSLSPKVSITSAGLTIQSHGAHLPQKSLSSSLLPTYQIQTSLSPTLTLVFDTLTPTAKTTYSPIDTFIHLYKQRSASFFLIEREASNVRPLKDGEPAI